MENLNYANLKETISDKPLVFGDWNHLTQILKKNFHDNTNYIYIENDQPVDIYFEINKEQIEFNTNLDTTKKFRCCFENFEFYLNHLANIYSKKIESSNSKNTNLFQFLKNKHLWPKSHQLFSKLNYHLAHSQNIIEFTQQFFKLDEIDHFKTIHLFIHKKGAIFASHHEIKKDSDLKARQPVSEFTNLFQAIKKSKNRSFGQASLKAANFQILGTCIAHEFSLLNHNLILIFSKDDFIPQDDKDVAFFNDFKNCFSSFFEILLNIEFNKDKSNSLFAFLKNLPGFEILQQENYTSIGNNNIYKSLLNINYQDILQKLQEEHLNLADINHQERINLLGELLNTLKHELSNPLFGLQLSGELLSHEDWDEEQAEFISHINTSIKRSQSIIDNFAGLYKENPNKEIINIENLIHEVFTLTKSESKQVKKSVEFVGEKNIEVNTNPTYLAQILFNLIINSSQALKEADTAGPEIKVLVENKIDKLILMIQDNGPGISEELKDKVFEAFYTTKPSGTGLGLAISKRLAEKINGSLTPVESAQGASFKLEINL